MDSGTFGSLQFAAAARGTAVEVSPAGRARGRQRHTGGPAAPALARLPPLDRRCVLGRRKPLRVRPKPRDEGGAAIHAPRRPGSRFDHLGNGFGTQRLPALRRRIPAGWVSAYAGSGGIAETIDGK